MREPIWISRRLLDVMHSQLILEYGGKAGIRDENAIDAALARPQNKYAYENVDLATLAAAYGYGLARSHGYVDGNKRAATAAMGVSLDLNGLELVAPEQELVRVMVSLAAGNFTEKALSSWIAESTRSGSASR